MLIGSEKLFLLLKIVHMYSGLYVSVLCFTLGVLQVFVYFCALRHSTYSASALFFIEVYFG
jgi:hypothetical protein